LIADVEKTAGPYMIQTTLKAAVRNEEMAGIDVIRKSVETAA
jgi:hypothetical protein